jgi:LysM repeat protein
MNTIRQLNILFRPGKLAISATLVLAMLAAFLPQTALAATTCESYYTVESGDTTPYISQRFGFKWRDIAKANDMTPEDKPSVGQVLCIPPLSKSSRESSTSGSTTTGVKVSQPDDESRAVFSVSITGRRIFTTLSNFNNDHVYLAKVRDAKIGIDGWYNLGRMSIVSDSSQSFSFPVPTDLRNTLNLSVCFKDQTTNELVCRKALNP